MKKYIVFALSFTLLFPSPSFSSPKKPVYKTVAKKVVVKKPIVKQVAAKPTPTPSPSAVVEAPKVVEPTPTPTPTAPAQPISFDNLDLVWTSKVARSDLITEFEKLKQPENTYELVVGPNVKSITIDEEKRLLNIAVRMFSAYFLPNFYQIVFFSEKDGSWAEQTKGVLGGNFPGSFQSQIDKEIYGCTFGFASRSKNDTPIFYQCLDSKVERNISDKQTAIHEYFHLVQQKYQIQSMPCWIVEGSATYFGAALGIDGTDPTGKSSFTFIKQLSWQYNPGGSNSNPPNTRLIDKIISQGENGALEVYMALDTPCHAKGLGHYALGSIATEALIAVKGYKTYMDFVTTFSNTSDWKAEFKKAYGLSTEDFYRKLTPYLGSRIANLDKLK